MEGVLVLPQSLPLGFRFRPTDEELVNHYLKRKINGRIKSDVVVIPEVDVCKCEPWDLPDKSLIRSEDPEWFFFGPKDRKYPNGHRSNRATEAGYWKATGKDRTVKTRPPSAITIGMKKTLVFHRGRAPKGERTNWIMHEYRAVEPEFEQGGFVLYRLFKKPEEKARVSNEDEMDFSDFFPAKTKSSNDTTVQGEDSLEEELCAMLNQDIVVHTYDKVSNAMEKSNESDGGISSKDEDGDRESFSEFLDAILFNSAEGGTPDNSRILANSTEVVPDAQLYDIKLECPLEYISGSDSVICDNVDIEALLLQQDPCLDSSCKFQGPPSPSSFCLQHLPNSYSNAGAQCDDYFIESVDFANPRDLALSEFSTADSFQGNGMLESSEDSNNLFGVSSDYEISNNYLFINEQSLGNVNNPLETGIKLKARRGAIHARNQDNTSHTGPLGMIGQGFAMRRIRLQKSSRAGFHDSTDDKSSNIEESRDGKSEIHEAAGQDGELSNDEKIPSPVRAANVAAFSSSDDDDIASSVDVKQPDSSNSKVAPSTRTKSLANNLTIQPVGLPRQKASVAASVNFGRVTVVVSILLLVLCMGIAWMSKYLTGRNNVYYFL